MGCGDSVDTELQLCWPHSQKMPLDITPAQISSSPYYLVLCMKKFNYGQYFKVNIKYSPSSYVMARFIIKSHTQYHCMTGRAMRGNIQFKFEAGSIGLTGFCWSS